MPDATAPAARRPRSRRRTAEAKPEPEPKTLDELLGELDALIGLTDVKAEIHRKRPCFASRRCAARLA
jgi:hypothetical protein